MHKIVCHKWLPKSYAEALERSMWENVLCGRMGAPEPNFERVAFDGLFRVVFLNKDVDCPECLNWLHS